MGAWGSDGTFQSAQATELRPEDYVISGSNPLVAAANPLLVLIPQIRNSKTHENLDLLRERLVDEIRQFELRAQHAGVSNETILGARYCLCTVLDEACALTPWGGHGQWSGKSLLVTFHNETWGG
ncbi:MAG: type VI secretion system protein TssL, partial [Oligella ureolytica]|nr:type VI secretion system protein TssL [Oligella ureolytica]